MTGRPPENWHAVPSKEWIFTARDWLWGTSSHLVPRSRIYSPHPLMGLRKIKHKDNLPSFKFYKLTCLLKNGVSVNLFEVETKWQFETTV
jgi:hypothetical protein